MKRYFLSAILFSLLFVGQSFAQITPEQQAQKDRCAKLQPLSVEWRAENCHRPGLVRDPASIAPNQTSPAVPAETKEQKCAKITPLSAEWMAAGCNTGASTTTDPLNIFGVAGSGGQSTGAINNNTSTDPSIITTTPGSGSAELNRCASIKFVSLLDILMWIKCIIVVAIIPLIFALAFMFFMWGVMKFIMASDSTKREEGKKFIIAGLIGLFVMTSLWGIITIVGNTLGTGSAVPLLQMTATKTTP